MSVQTLESIREGEGKLKDDTQTALSKQLLESYGGPKASGSLFLV